MGYKPTRISDYSEEIVAEHESAVVIVRHHPRLPKDSAARVLDINTSELSSLSCAHDKVTLEIRLQDGSTKRVTCTVEEFDDFFRPNALEEARRWYGAKAEWSPTSSSTPTQSTTR